MLKNHTSKPRGLEADLAINLSHLNTLVAAGESLTLELKKSTAEKDRASPSLCALANVFHRLARTSPANGGYWKVLLNK